ncbi:MAG: methyltransferase [Candidatus Nanoarchaeia archaeon]|nr:methyltransferase [Candidatus Nanoarchaeia archaeon]
MVYVPAEDSYLLKKWVSKLSKGKTVLDMGTGEGFLAISAKSSGALSVIGVDKNVDAVKVAERNAKNAKLDIEFRYSDLFLTVPGSFDLIIFNPPYLPLENGISFKNDYDLIGGEKGNELSIEFLRQAPNHLNHGGIVLMICSSMSNPFEIFNYAKSFGFNFEILEELKIDFETLYCVKFVFKG